MLRTQLRQLTNEVEKRKYLSGSGLMMCEANFGRLGIGTVFTGSD